MNHFVHLDTQSAYSFLWGTYTPEDLVQAVKNRQQPAVALTDDGLFGLVRFCRAAKAAAIQPIIGAKLPLTDGSRITLLVRNRTGFGHLCQLLSLVWQDGFVPQPNVRLDDLKHHAQGLICLAGGWGSPLDEAARFGSLDSGRAWLRKLQEVFPHPDELFAVVQHHEQPGDDQAIAEIWRLAGELGLEVVATSSTAYLRPEDGAVHQALVAIQQKHHHRKVQPLPSRGFHLAASEEMARRIPYPRALENSSRIAELCREFSLPLGRLHPPSFRPPEMAASNLAALCLRELARLLKPTPLAYLRRLDKELSAVSRRGLADFFLLTREVVEFARLRDIRHSVRGSAAGSLITYLTMGGVDPVANDLLFERFINDGRADMPDLDIDFDSERRDEVLHHLMDRFPQQAAMVATVHTLKVRSAVRLSARALDYPLEEIKRLSVCLPWSLRGRNLMEALATLPELRHSPLHQETRLVELASRLGRLPFQASVHLGGVIIAPERITDWTPVGRSPKGFPVSHLDKDDVEALGLLKLDVLGLRMHTAIRKALNLLATQGRPLNLDRVPLNDYKTYALLRSTESLGVFQVESPGQRQLLGRLQPRCFADLVAEISLFRPGPVEGNMVDPYVRRSNDLEAVVYPHPVLAPILKETYGVILFQEHVLRIVHAFAGLSYSEADVFRRTMTKDRKPGQMEMLRQRFIAGAQAQGHAPNLAAEVFGQVLALAAYGFCKAHAASFAHITYQSAYLKANFPQAFYLGLLNAGQVGSYPAAVILNEARRRGLPVYPPHVNASDLEYVAEGRGLRVPLTVIHGVGPGLAKRIVQERKKSGVFISRENFLDRVSIPHRLLKVIDLAGALDHLESDLGRKSA